MICGLGTHGQIILLISLSILIHCHSVRSKVLARLAVAFIQFILLLSLRLITLHSVCAYIVLLLLLLRLFVNTITVVNLNSLIRLSISILVRCLINLHCNDEIIILIMKTSSLLLWLSCKVCLLKTLLESW